MLLTAVLTALISSSVSLAANSAPYPEIVPVLSTVTFEGKSEYPGRCTGTFVAPRFLLTAAHCVRQFNVTVLGGVVSRAQDMSGRDVPDQTAGPRDVFVYKEGRWGGNKIYPIRVYVSGSAEPESRADLGLDRVRQDLAILEFAQDWPVTRPVAEEAPLDGTPVVIVGYGQHFGQVKSVGFNKVNRFGVDDLIVDGSSQTCDEPKKHVDDWATCPGDSGGPLLDRNSGRILGVASTFVRFDKVKGPRASRAASIFVDVSSAEARDFIKRVTGK